jgi:hypothetical protein
MPKMGISVDTTTHQLLKKHGGERHIGALIGKMVRDFDREEAFGSQAIQQRLDRIENRLLALTDRKERCGEQ